MNQKKMFELLQVAAAQMELTEINFKIVFAPKDTGDGTIMTVNRNFPYLDVLITVYPLYRKANYEYLVHACYHEMAHVLLWNVYKKASDRFVNEQDLEDTFETTVERIANIMARRHG